MKKSFLVILVLTFSLVFSACENTDNTLVSSDTKTVQNNINYDSLSVTSSQEEISSTESVMLPSNSSVSETTISSTGSQNLSSSNSEYISSVTNSASCNHNFIQTVNTATCINNGQATYTCSICKATYKEQVNATGHKWKEHKCTICGEVDENKMKENLYNWAIANSVEENFSKYYYLPSDSRYKFSAIGGGNYFFIFNDKENNEYISISVYGFEKNKCYICYILNDLKIEGEFPMDAVHSEDRNFFNVMNADSNEAASKKEELITSLRGKIDGFLKRFETEMLIPNTSITLNDLGFKCY